MNSKMTSEPSVLQEALRTTTETLAAQLARPGDAPPDWSELQWRTARAVAGIHGVSALLATRLRWEGPPDWQQFVRDQKHHTRLRHERLAALRRSLDEQLQSAGIAGVALKGFELYARGFYGPGERPMADLDLLVRKPDLETATDILETLGFQRASTCWKHQTFIPRIAHRPGPIGEHGANDLKIELHEHVSERLPLSETDISDLVFPQHPRSGLNAYPSKAALMAHLLLHAAGSMTGRALRLIHLHDLALVSVSMTERDWTQLMIDTAGGPALWWALPPLSLTARYYADCIPESLLTILSAGSRWMLSRASRSYRLSDVSLSRLHIEAFPGIEWCQSLSETIRFVTHRVWPDRATVSMREDNVRYEAWASNNPWCELPHHRRVLRWVTTRPARPATMHALRAALEESP